MSRKKIKPEIEAKVLSSSRRRCCLCFGVNREFSEKKGQIAHLDKDNTNASFDNLAFLCFEHHDIYDSKTSQSKNYTISEVKEYREELYSSIIPIIEKRAKITKPQDNNSRQSKSLREIKRDEIKQIILEVMTEMGPEHSLIHLAWKTGLARHSVESLLYELSEENIIRIDRTEGTNKKAYSLVNSFENRLIDTFITSLESAVVSDNRFLRTRQYEIDAIIETDPVIYCIEAIVSKGNLTAEHISGRLSQLTQAAENLHYEKITRVLLIGITDKTIIEDIEFDALKQDNIIIKLIEME